MTHSNYEKRTPDLPSDTDLPFFAYGIFKPGQLAYSKIRPHILEIQAGTEINYRMKIRDGVPILIDDENSCNLTKGTLITFKKGHEKKAYECICKTLLRKLYRWGTVEIDGKSVNVVFGVKPENGSNEIEDPRERVNFDGKKDPLFSDAIELIERNLKSYEFSWKSESFFELQMNYMLLWTAIDRYSSLKYNETSKNQNNQEFSDEKAFKKGIKKFKDRHHTPVYSTEDVEIYRFNADDAFETMKYYYTFRCNVVHRGKAMYGDFNMLKTATEELLEIFKEILKDTFKR